MLDNEGGGRHVKYIRRWLGIAPLIAAAAMAVATASAGAPPRPRRGVSGSITVWVDAVRLPAAKAYVKAHPNVKVKIVTFDGDGNGATTLQTKIQLWNRTGNGWPDVDLQRAGQRPGLDGAEALRLRRARQGPHPGRRCSASGRRRRPPSAPSTAGSICVQDNLAQVVLWVQQEADGQVRLHRPHDLAGVGGARPEGRHRAPRLHHRQHR